MSKVSARNVTVEVDGKVPYGLTDCQLQLTTVFESSQTKEDIAPVDEPMRVDWTITMTCNFGREDATENTVGTALDFKVASKTGEKRKVAFRVHDPDSSPDFLYGGDALVSSYQEDAPVDGKLTYTVTFKGVSEFSRPA